MINYISKFNKCDTFVILWCLYRLQNIAYAQGIINQILVFVILAWSIIVGGDFFLKFCKKSSFVRALGMLIFMFATYGLIAITASPIYFHTGKIVTSHVYFLDSMKSLLPIFVFAMYAYNGELTRDRIKVYFLMILPIIIANYYLNYNNMVMESIIGKTEFTNNKSYEFLSLFPMILFFDKRPLLQYLFALILSYFILMGMKRGAILIALFCLLFFMINAYRMSNKSHLKFVVIFLMVGSVIALVKSVLYMIDNSPYFLKRIEQTLEGNSSGRDNLISNIMTTVFDNSIFQWLFGRGANSTVSISGNFAHQDWVEILCNNGLIGFFIFFNFFRNMFSTFFRNKNIENNNLKYIFYMLFCVLFMKSLFSMSIQDFDFCLTIIIGFLLANILPSKKRTNNI